MGFVLGRSWIIFIFKFQGTCKSRIQNEIPSLDSNAGILIPLTKTCNYGLTCQPLLPFGSCFHISLNNLFKKKKKPWILYSSFQIFPDCQVSGKMKPVYEYWHNVSPLSLLWTFSYSSLHFYCALKLCVNCRSSDNLAVLLSVKS